MVVLSEDDEQENAEEGREKDAYFHSQMHRREQLFYPMEFSMIIY